MNWAWSQLQKSGPAKTGPAGLLATALDVAKTYDILGWIAPTVLSMKMLYQTLWQKGHEWDEDVPADLADLHARWRTELPLLSQ